MRHFQRLSFPAGVNTGKGIKAAYTAESVVSLVVAFELLELGNTPERASYNTRLFWPEIVRAMDAGYQSGPDKWAIAAFHFRQLDHGIPEADRIRTLLVDLTSKGDSETDLRALVALSGAVVVNLSILATAIDDQLTPDEANAFRKAFAAAANAFESGERSRA